jgi:hypothetical protein
MIRGVDAWFAGPNHVRELTRRHRPKVRAQQVAAETPQTALSA